jgi:hypothetical protein
VVDDDTALCQETTQDSRLKAPQSA